MRGFQPVIGLLCLIILLAACGPEATPFPVDLPTPDTAMSASLGTPEAAPGVNAAPGVIRYALAANIAGLVDDLSLIEQTARVETLAAPVNPDDLGSRYDIIAAYGDLPGGQRSPIEHHVALVLNPALSPTNDADIAGILRRAINPQAILPAMTIPGAMPELLESDSPTTLRVELANAGWPDGFDLNLVYDDAPGVEAVIAALQSISIVVYARQADDALAAFETNQANLALITWSTPEERATWEKREGDANVIPLYTLPISYLAVEGLTITFTPSGWPVAHR